MTLTAYDRAQRAGQQAVRTAILDAATALLVADGVAALTVRRIAGRVGCSTKVIYTMFGGKDGLVEALWLEGFARFARALRSVPRGADPIGHLRGLGRAYRAYALAEPDYYRVMFGGAVPGFRPGRAAVGRTGETFTILVDAVEWCMREGVFAPGDPVETADMLWVSAHGAVSLELAGIFEAERAERAAAGVADALLRALTRRDGPGEERHPAEPPEERE